MHEDDLILLFGYLLLGAATYALTMRSRQKRRVVLINVLTMVLYSAPLLYGLFALSKEGNALAWWFYLLLAIIAHLLVVCFLWVRSLATRPSAS